QAVDRDLGAEAAAVGESYCNHRAIPIRCAEVDGASRGTTIGLGRDGLAVAERLFHLARQRPGMRFAEQSVDGDFDLLRVAEEFEPVVPGQPERLPAGTQ